MSGHQHVGPGNPDTELAEDDFANEIHGNNRLQGKDQVNFRNQRQKQAGATKETEGVVESYKKPQPGERGKD